MKTKTEINENVLKHFSTSNILCVLFKLKIKVWMGIMRCRLFLFFSRMDSAFQNCIYGTQMSSGTGTQTAVPVPMPCDKCPASTAALPCCVFHVPHPPGVSSSPKLMTMMKGMFSAGHLDTDALPTALHISHPRHMAHSNTSQLSG